MLDDRQAGLLTDLLDSARSIRTYLAAVSHNYGEVDLELVWKTATADLPVLIETLERHFDGAGSK